MTTLDSLKDSWRSEGLLDKEGKFTPTFIEDVGTASAENVRSAALMRWARRNGEDARKWLKSLLGYEVGELSPKREVQLLGIDHKSKGRIDLDLMPDQTPNRILAEVKWCTSPDHEQIEKYNEATEVKDHGKFILLTPIEVMHEYHGSHNPVLKWAPPFPTNVVFTTWTALRDYLHNRSLEDGIFSQTIGRWSSLGGFVSKCAKDNAIPDLLELVKWLTDEETQAPKDYRTLVIQLVLARIAENICANLGRGEWFRGYPYKGSKGDAGGDLTVDIYHKAQSFTAFEDNATGVSRGMLVCIRLRVPGVSHPELQVQIGTKVNPYSKIHYPNPPMDKVETLRRKVVGELRKYIEGMERVFPVYTPNSKDRWQCQASKSVTDWNEVLTSAMLYREVIRSIMSHGDEPM